MSLYQPLYELYRNIDACELVSTKNPTDENMTEFVNLLNQCVPSNPKEEAYRELTRSMYYANPAGFFKYIMASKNRVKALVLYTESKRMVMAFGLKGKIHIKWDETTNTYSVTRHIPREKRTGYTSTQSNADKTQDEKTLVNDNAQVSENSMELKETVEVKSNKDKYRPPREERERLRVQKKKERELRKESKEPRIPKEHKKREPREQYVPKEPREHKEPRAPRAPKEPRAPKSSHSAPSASAANRDSDYSVEDAHVPVLASAPVPTQ